MDKCPRVGSPQESCARAGLRSVCRFRRAWENTPCGGSGRRRGWRPRLRPARLPPHPCVGPLGTCRTHGGRPLGHRIPFPQQSGISGPDVCTGGSRVPSGLGENVRGGKLGDRKIQCGTQTCPRGQCLQRKLQAKDVVTWAGTATPRRGHVVLSKLFTSS